ncbi:MAG: iron-containing redox enzyme family protein [Gammaproteobacteria bacterium]|nr:iron-containing redox enzyme family protein [Gammaproteobacteria bacterium]
MSKIFCTKEQFAESISNYASNKCFEDIEINPSDPYHRPIRRNDLAKLDCTKDVQIADVFGNKNLILNKLLLTIYEQDLLFLDQNYTNPHSREAFKSFYDPYFVANGKALRPFIEKLVFGFLDNEIEIIGKWNKDKLNQYLQSVITEQESTKSELCTSIENLDKPELAGKMLLIQMAPDFLSEASAMARTLPGAYGEEQSEIMKVFIDEYGYGVHHAKHSTLFESTLESIGMNKNLHHYYDSYLPTSLMLVNYFHYVCGNKHNWFKYLGALYYTEASIPHFNKQISAVLRKILPGIDTKYFDEHVHIDQHHRRMVLDKIIGKSIDRYGESIIDDILHGFESFRLLQTLADKDLIEQMHFSSQLKSTPQYKPVGEKKYFTESLNELTSAHIHSESELFTVIAGELDFNANGVQSIVLGAGEKIIIPKGRLHGTRIRSNSAKYCVESICISEG